MSFYCGINLGARKSHLCLINENDKRLLDKKMNNDLDEIEYKLYPYKSSLKIVAESTFNWEWLVYGRQHRDYDVQLAHTLGLKAISWSKKKTDKWDAFTLARLLRVNMIPQAYIYPYELRPIRDLLRERIHLVIKRATEYSAISRMLLRYNIQGYNRNMVKHLTEKDMHQLYHHPFIRSKATMELERIDLLTKQIDSIDKKILERAKENYTFYLLKTVPGIGDILALTILYEVGDINRFANARAFCSYCRVIVRYSPILR